MKWFYALWPWRAVCRGAVAKMALKSGRLFWLFLAMWSAGAQIIQPESLEAEIIPATVRIEKAVVSGKLRLNVANDSVFEELYRLVSDADPAHPGILAHLPAAERRVFLAWYLPADRAAAKAKGKEVILEFDGATVERIVETVAKAREMVAMRFFMGGLFFPKASICPRKMR